MKISLKFKKESLTDQISRALSNFQIDPEDPFYDTTMRTRHAELLRNLEQRNTLFKNRFKRALLSDQKQVRFGSQRDTDMSRRPPSSRQSELLAVFESSKMSSQVNFNKRRFFSLASKFKGVCLARCSPSMKSLVTKLLSHSLGKVVMAVGDGGNDVGMIQIAHIGVGVLGKEGNQAALAADFNITQFRYSSRLSFERMFLQTPKQTSGHREYGGLCAGWSGPVPLEKQCFYFCRFFL